MIIRFLCPAGHKVHCPEEQAGRGAKCPQCGVRFRVPPVGVAEDARAEKIDAPSGPASASGSQAGSSSTKLSVPKSGSSVGKPKEPQIEFLCPNGHRLNGPASLQGRPGQCPECGSRFRIPTYDNVSEEEEIEQNVDGYPDEEPQADAEEPVSDEGGYTEENYSLGFADGVADEQPVDEGVAEESGPSEGAEPLRDWASIVAALWLHKPSGVGVEIVTSDGETIVVDRYSAALSRQDCGVFGAKGSNGSYAITALAWSAISRITVQGLKHLPADLFD